MSISAKQVMELRAATGLGMMRCKQALTEMDGDFEKAQELLRKELGKAAEKKAGRKTGEGLVRVKMSDDHKSGTAVVILCETEPVKNTPMFVEFVDKVVELAFENGVGTVEELEAVAWPGDEPTVGDALKALIGTIGENMKLANVARLSATNGGYIGSYVHFNDKIGVLISLSGEAEDKSEAAKEIGMHLSFGKPQAMTRDEIPEDEVAKELSFLRDQVAEDPKMAGKPEQAIEGIVQGRLNKNFFGERVFMEQAWSRDPSKKVKNVLDEMNVAVHEYAVLQVGG